LWFFCAGGAGIGATPWNTISVVFGVGAGCGIGVGFGFGSGAGYRLDRPPKQSPPQKLVIIEI
jgi:hypothetical protein